MSNFNLKIKKLFILIITLSVSFSFANVSKDINNIKTKQNNKIKPKECNTKKYCKNMSSYEEAMFYFKVCGDLKLDKNKDSIPCENVCKK